MLISDFNTSIGFTLQDSPHTRWIVAELLVYMNDGLRDYAVKTMSFPAKETFTMSSTVTSYFLTGEIIKLKSIKPNSGVFEFGVPTPREITVLLPKNGVVVTVEYFTVPTLLTNISTVIDFFHNTIEALRYYVLMRCYQKDETNENFQKAAYYEQRYMQTVSQNADGYASSLPVTPYQNDFYV